MSAEATITSGNLAERPTPATAADRPLSQTVHLSVRDDDICVLTFDRPGSAANLFDRSTLEELREALDWIAAQPQIKGLVLTSAKRSIFIAGADLKMLTGDAPPEAVREVVEVGQDVMNRLVTLPIPTVAAIHGAAVGGGYELCLACDYRVASPDRATKIGLPETQLGLLPAWGGSTRLPRLIGLPGALDVILGARTLAAKPALKRGMIDEVVAPEYLMTMATRLISRGKRHQPRHWALNNPVVASIVRARLHSRLLKKTRG